MKESREVNRTAVTAIPATCGELVQGIYQGEPCLVSCPIDKYSTAKVTISQGTHQEQKQPQLSKANQALLAGLTWFGHENYNGCLNIETSIPSGRGYGSSTADIGAVLYALAQACERPLSATQATLLAAEIEPSDSTLFSSLTMLNHLNGKRIETLSDAPNLNVLVIDPGEVIDTIKYNQQVPPNTLTKLAPIHQITFDLLRQGLQMKDWKMVGKAATLSATAHQKILFNPMLDNVLKITKSVSALGVCRAHSGSLLGLLLDPATTNIDEIRKYIQPRLPAHVKTLMTTLVNGGPRYGMESSNEMTPKKNKINSNWTKPDSIISAYPYQLEY